MLYTIYIIFTYNSNSCKIIYIQSDVLWGVYAYSFTRDSLKFYEKPEPNFEWNVIL